MEGYLGEFPTDLTLTPEQGAMLYIEMYGQIDGGHHKAWVLDQVARILKGAPITITEARWDNGYKELRYRVGSSEEYERWVIAMRDGEDGPDTYTYDVGIAP